MQRIIRSQSDRLLTGVCGGVGVLLYIILALILPEQIVATEDM